MFYLDTKVFTDNKQFWKSIKPLFSDKQKSHKNEIILIENDNIISDSKEVAETINHFFTTVVEYLGIKPWKSESYITDLDDISDIIKYMSHIQV